MIVVKVLKRKKNICLTNDVLFIRAYACESLGASSPIRLQTFSELI